MIPGTRFSNVTRLVVAKSPMPELCGQCVWLLVVQLHAMPVLRKPRSLLQTDLLQTVGRLA